jgi:hypothetical protein
MIQPKLKIGAVGDRYEQEADRVAQDVVQRINAPAPKTGDKDELRMKPMVQRLSDGSGMAAPPDLDTSIQGARGGGQPLAESIRQPMEQAFGADFSGVRVHTDAKSDKLNQSIQAKAFTTGQDVFFRQGVYEPGSRRGQELIAHELTHVVQQNGGAVQREQLQRINGDKGTGKTQVKPPIYFYHATPKKNANAIAQDGLKARSGKKQEEPYLCMSGTEAGATTLGSSASDIIFRVATSNLDIQLWSKTGAGKEEWRGYENIPGNLLEYRRNLGKPAQKKWRWTSDKSHLPL